MRLEIIRKLSENRVGGLKKLATDINMSEANLHRCIRNNKIQASDLENIARLLMVDISTFFDNDVIAHQIVETKGNNSPASMYGDAMVKGDSMIYEERVKFLQQQIEDKNDLIKEKERIIQYLMNK